MWSIRRKIKENNTKSLGKTRRTTRNHSRRRLAEMRTIRSLLDSKTKTVITTIQSKRSKKTTLITKKQNLIKTCMCRIHLELFKKHPILRRSVETDITRS